jgi:hypothetical protein
MRIKEHQHHIQLHKQEKCEVTLHNADQVHRILLGNNAVITGKPWCINWPMTGGINFFFLSVDIKNRLFTPLKKKGSQAASKDKTA